MNTEDTDTDDGRKENIGRDKNDVKTTSISHTNNCSTKDDISGNATDEHVTKVAISLG